MKSAEEGGTIKNGEPMMVEKGRRKRSIWVRA